MRKPSFGGKSFCLFCDIILTNNKLLKLKILLADENNLFRKYLIDLITDNNDECITLNNNSDIYSAYKKYKPGCVLVNIGLNNNSGFKIVEELKKRNPDAVVAVLSEFDDKRISQRAKDIGADAFIPKEDLSKLLIEINKLRKKLYKSNH